MRTTGFLILLGIFVMMASGTSVLAQDYPSRSVRIVVGFPPGGGIDLQVRALADRLGKIWGQAVVSENISGASGGLGAVSVARSKPDGYSILFATHPMFAINPFIYEKLSYDLDRDFVPVIKLSDTQNILLVNSSSNIHQLSDLIRVAKEKPGSLHFGSGGLGTTQHLTGELFKVAANIEITHVPYRGTGPASTALLSNEIQMHFDSVYSSIARMKTGRVRGIAIASLQRFPALPDLPTMSESGLKNFESTLAFGLLLPAGTQANIVMALNRDSNKVLQDSGYKAQMQEQGLFLLGGSPEEFRAFLLAERRKWGDLLKRLNIKAE